MKINLLNTKQEQLLKQALDVYGRQHKAIAKNVANVNNPNYSRVSTDFSEALRKTTDESKMKATREKHIRTANLPRKHNQQQLPGKNEAVDISREMTDLAANQIKHEFVARALNRYFKGLSTSIVGRNQP